MSQRAGIVLAGGFAKRFEEGDKTLAELDGKPLIAHVVDALSPVVDRVVINCRSNQVEAFERVLTAVDYRPDPTPDRGPLAGLATALDDLDAGEVALATADRPRIPPGLYGAFFETLEREGVAIRSADIVQPAPAVFETEPLRASVRQRHGSGDRRLRAALTSLDLDTVPETTVLDRWGSDVLTDVNTVEDLERLRE